MIQLYQTLDLRPIGIPQTLRLSQYDSDFEIIFELTNFDGTWILDTDTTAEIQGTKTDGHGYSADAVFDDQLKTVTIAGDVQMTAAAGRNVYEVVLFHDGDRLGSKNFILDVERAALDAETTASDSKIKNFTEMVEAAEDAAETATAAAEAAEQAAARGGLSEEAKAALLACFRNVAWINDQGHTYYDALESALNGGQTRHIVAIFNQGQAEIYSKNPLSVLTPYLTVVDVDAEGQSTIVTGYTLGGQLETGESTISVLYDGMTTAFNVTVTDYTERMVYGIDDLISANGTQYRNTYDGYAQMCIKQNNYGRLESLAYGEYPQRDYETGALTAYYPIPVPATATKIKLTVTPNHLIIRPSTWQWTPTQNRYVRAQNFDALGYGAGAVDVNSFNQMSELYLSVELARSDSGEFTNADTPTAVSVTFE